MQLLPSRMNLRRSPRVGAVIRMSVLAVAAIALTAGTAWAQDGGRRGGRGGPGGMRGGGPMGQLFQPEFIRRDMALFDRELDLDDGQTTIVETLLFDYDSAFTEAVEAMRDRFSELRPERPEGWEQQREERRKVFGEMRELRREMRAAREAAEDGQPDAETMKGLQDRMDAMREKMQELRPPMPEGAELEQLRSSMSTLTKQWRAERAAIRREFMNDLQAVMSEEQIERWPAFERALTRGKKLRNGRLAGEQQDLFIVLREAGLADNDLWRIQGVLEEYAVALDTAVTARDAFLEEQQMEIFGAMMAGETERAAKLLEEEAQLRAAVRDVNRRYVETIAARVGEELPGPVADEFRTAYQRRAYPQVYRPTAAQRAFRVAQGLEGLDEEALVAVMTLEESYLTELAEVNRQLIDLTLRYEPERNARRMERRMSWMRGQRGGGGDPQAEREADPLQQGFERRTELDNKYRAMLESHLTPEQVAELPEPERAGRGGRGGDWGGGWRRGDRGARGDRGRRGQGDGADRGRRGRDGDDMGRRGRRQGQGDAGDA